MSPASQNSAAVQWADLLPELCDLVVDRLDAFGVLSFPATCTSWAAVCKESPRLRSGAPTMVTSGLDEYGNAYNIFYYDAGIFAVHDVSTGKTFRAEADGLRGRCWIGGKDDWLVTTDDECNAELLNPITGARVGLPSFATIPGVEVEGRFHLHVPHELHSCQIQRVVLCQTPSHRKGYLAVALFSPNFLAFTAAGDECWTALKNPTGGRLRYTDCIVHEGKVVAVSENGDIFFWEMDGKTTDPVVQRGPEIQISYPLECRFNLATSIGGQIILVCMYGQSIWDRRIIMSRMVYNEQGIFHARRISLHELDAYNRTWRHVSGLGGERSLFLGASYPFYVTVPPGSKDLKANCVYVADMTSCDAAVFDLERGGDYSFEPLVYPGDSTALQTPMWFRPTAYYLER
ncbi:uncharacterized protein LOC133889614 [Phragmites australis]|uniref:uncharacterized protein LOC133889614 n=1 Tax=Phragmites australis TaxID=29695 RepID=UPI002D78F424|nr:uncharacterized protein LOC133889614 [Phragmites australis]